MATILVIDDDVDIVEVVKLVLEDEGFTVMVDSTGTYFNRPTAQLPDLILLDLLIEGNNGELIAKELKNRSRTKKIPIIVVSAHTPTEVRSVVQRSGADGYVTKPFDIDNLVATVKTFISP